MWHVWTEGTIVKKLKRDSSSHQKFITDKNFNAGIKFWQNETYWPRDFHNRFYAELAEINKDDQFSIEWWYRILPHLSCWRATRPKSAKELTQRARPRLGRLKRAFQAISDAPNDIAVDGLNWEIVEGFTIIAADIKGANPPTFCSKLCHFISPKRFPVTDSGAMGSPKENYKDYWNCVRDEWRATPKELQERLKKRLESAADVSLPSDFPYACKIAEICLIGKNQRH